MRMMVRIMLVVLWRGVEVDRCGKPLTSHLARLLELTTQLLHSDSNCFLKYWVLGIVTIPPTYYLLSILMLARQWLAHQGGVLRS